MKRVCKSALSLVGGAALLSAAQVMLPEQQASAQTVDRLGAGSALVFPYYTVRDGWKTLINVTNTTPYHLATKIRIHEAHNTRDVLDFVVMLSPYDVWTAWLQPSANPTSLGAPQLFTNDASCTSPLNVSGATASREAYINTPGGGQFADGGDASSARMGEGYITMMVMGEWQPAAIANTTPWYAEHVAGVPRNCELADANWVHDPAVGNWAPPTGDVPGTMGSGDPVARGDGIDGEYAEIISTHPLKGNLTLVNQGRGLAGGQEAIAIRGWGAGQNLVTAQQFPWFLEPTLPSHLGLWNLDGVFPVNAALNTWTLSNEWSNLPGTGAKTDWVVTFPTKAYHVDQDVDNIQAACTGWRRSGGDGTYDDTRVCTLEPFEEVFQDLPLGVSRITVQYDVFDREEGSFIVVTDGTQISPAQPPEVQIDTFPYETNVMTIYNGDCTTLLSILESEINQEINTSSLDSGACNGWLQVTFPQAGGAAAQRDAGPLPAVGFIFKGRDFGDPEISYGQIMDHAYSDEPPPLVP